MDAIRIAVVPPRVRRFHGLRSLVSILVFRIRPREARPWIVAVNRVGAVHPLFPVDSMAEADAKAERLTWELRTFSLAQWVARYRLPEEFVDPKPRPI